MWTKILQAAAGAALIVMIALVSGTLVPRPLPHETDLAAGAGNHRILILSNPIHTDLAIPVVDIPSGDFGFLRESGLAMDASGLRYLVFGWGGRAFYTQTPTWADLKPVPILKGLTVDRSVMHVSLAGDIPQDGPEVTAIDLTDAAMAQLTTFIRESFTEGSSGPMLLPGVSYGQYDVFFEANGYFNALAGCNTWTAAALRHAGLSTGWWTPLPAALVWSLRLHNPRDILK